MNIINIDISEPYKTFMINREKTVEGRLNKGKFLKVRVGDVLQINPDGILFKITAKKIYLSFKEMIEKEGIRNVIPDKNEINEAVSVYYDFYTKEQEKEFGVVAFKVSKM